MKRSGFTYIAVVSILLIVFSCSNSKKDKTQQANNRDTNENIASKENTDSSSGNTVLKENRDTSRVFKGIYDLPENTIASSPTAEQSIMMGRNEKIVDYDVSPLGPVVAAIIKDTTGNYGIKFWQVSHPKFSDSCFSFNGYVLKAVVWHPRATALFVIGLKNRKYYILKIEKGDNGWVVNSIYSSEKELRRLVACPRPFIVGYNYKNREEYYAYRIFFGMANDGNSNRIVTITENGDRFYQVIGPQNTITHYEEEFPPSEMVASDALPIAFHPAGHQMIWEDRNHSFFVADYNSKSWGNYAPVAKGISNSGTITPTPNGLGLIHWQKNKRGIGLYLLNIQKEVTEIPEYQFVSTPSSVPDGKGIVGTTITNGKMALSYVPIKVPLADISNAWMYLKSEEEMNLFQKNYGLFRINKGNQLYDLYETENYYCGQYDMSTPTRPYMITTDVFWELFGAAYQGLFIVREREDAIPSFWKFIDKTNQYFTDTKSKSRWLLAFTALSNLESGNTKDQEVIKMQSQQLAYSDVSKQDFDYSQLKPRGYYAATDEMQKYFMAFKYLTTIFEKEPKLMQELNSLPNEIKVYAVQWINSYMGLISNPRSSLVWSDVKVKRPSYHEYPGEDPTLFPLSWGIDNEILYSTTFHSNLPENKQIIGNNGPRFLPSGLDIAAVLGNGFAETLLQADYEKYPPLRKVINNLKDNFKSKYRTKTESKNLYDLWMNALAVQWADTIVSPNANADKNIYAAKRLQTGLASWATLRHATVLVNERDAAECGEGGFEEIVLNAPRGYVEPDPYTFGAIASLFEDAIKYVPESMKGNTESELNDEKGSLYDGIIKRLKETAKDIRMFQAIAQKEKRGEPLTNDEYQHILYVGRDVEHYFLIFKSLANKDYALSTPDPVAKIVDVAEGNGSYLLSAVGNAMEWDNIVPYFGRHEIVKGSIYSYFEFPSGQLLNDKEWQKSVDDQEYLPWLKSYITKRDVDYPATTGY